MIFLPVSDGQDRCAAMVWQVSRCSRASRLIGPPRLVGNNGSLGSAWRSATQVLKVVIVLAVSGVMRSFRPFPVAADVCAGSEMDVIAGQSDQLGGP